jgi:hypothetical protein
LHYPGIKKLALLAQSLMQLELRNFNKVEVITGVLEKECALVLSNFFEDKR